MSEGLRVRAGFLDSAIVLLVHGLPYGLLLRFDEELLLAHLIHMVEWRGLDGDLVVHLDVELDLAREVWDLRAWHQYHVLASFEQLDHLLLLLLYFVVLRLL